MHAGISSIPLLYEESNWRRVRSPSDVSIYSFTMKRCWVNEWKWVKTLTDLKTCSSCSHDAATERIKHLQPTRLSRKKLHNTSAASPQNSSMAFLWSFLCLKSNIQLLQLFSRMLLLCFMFCGLWHWDSSQTRIIWKSEKVKGNRAEINYWINFFFKNSNKNTKYSFDWASRWR